MKKSKIIFRTGIAITILVIAFCVYFNQVVKIAPPAVDDSIAKIPAVENHGDTLLICGDNWLRKNKYGLWEMMVEGKPYERGLIIGKLSQKLIYRQETAFVRQIDELVPSKLYLNLLRYFIAWFNKNLDSYIDDEYKKEIYGLSNYASDEYNFIATKYQRILNYHAAHDIGHALQGLNMVGCTSFSVWDSLSVNGDMIVGRNFDFYVGDEFSKEKIICFMKPSDGFRFMMITWGGMIGTVSGMNENGLSVTINAAQSSIPMSAATPISLVARRILQYSKNIKEAFKIAQSYKTFVSETIMIGSREDAKTYLIEKTPNKTGLFTPTSNYTICANHYQSELLGGEEENQKNIKENSTMYRFKRVKELLLDNRQTDVLKAAYILRNQLGLNNDSLGFGNEKAINQLIAHHSVIFDTKKLLAYVSTAPYQLGPYVAYDLNKVFALRTPPVKDINEESLTIPADPFLFSPEFAKFNHFKQLRKEISESIKQKDVSGISDTKIADLISSNPNYYEAYDIAADYYWFKKDIEKCKKYYSIALSKQFPSLSLLEKVQKKYDKCSK